MAAIKFILAGVVFVAFHSVFSILWNFVLFKKRYAKLTEKVARAKPVLWEGFLIITVIAVILVIFFSMFATGTNPVMEGLKLGLLIGSLFIICASWAVPARFNIKPAGQFATMEFVYWTLNYAIGGIIIALILL